MWCLPRERPAKGSLEHAGASHPHSIPSAPAGAASAKGEGGIHQQHWLPPPPSTAICRGRSITHCAKRHLAAQLSSVPPTPLPPLDANWKQATIAAPWGAASQQWAAPLSAKKPAENPPLHAMAKGGGEQVATSRGGRPHAQIVKLQQPPPRALSSWGSPCLGPLPRPPWSRAASAQDAD